MLKDIFLALFLGALLGFGLTGGYFAVNKKRTTTTPPASEITSAIPSPITSINTPTSTETNNTSTINHQITIDSPLNQSLVSNSKITIKGTTSPNSFLVISTPVKSYYYQSDAAGNFSIDVEIDSGANLIDINSFDANDNSAKATILVTYSTAKI
jgi:hypothetical protein